MFSGIVAEVGRIAGSVSAQGGRRLHVACSFEAQIGDSVAVSGVCLTVVALQSGILSFDVSDETLAVTTLGHLDTGAAVNLEQALRLSDRLNGHIVQGHVDGRGRIVALAPEGEGQRLAIDVPPALRRYVAHKGSLTVNGISLTVALLQAGRVEFAIIPHTFENTDLRERHVGDDVNLEVDVLARYLEALASGEEAGADV